MTTQVCTFNPTNFLIDVMEGLAATTSNPLDAGKPILANSTGTLDSSFITNPYQVLVTAAEDLPTGSIVNLYSSSNITYARLASASASSNYIATGYVTSSAPATQTVPVFFGGLLIIPFTSGFSPSDVGSPVYLSNTTPGAITLTPPTFPDATQSLGYVYQVTGTTDSNIYISFLASPSTQPRSWTGVPTGAIDGVNLVYTLPAAPTVLLLFRNGMMQTPGGVDFTLSANTITYVTPLNPATGGDPADAHYAIAFF